MILKKNWPILKDYLYKIVTPQPINIWGGTLTPPKQVFSPPSIWTSKNKELFHPDYSKNINKKNPSVLSSIF